MAQAVSFQPLTAEAVLRTRVNPCGICSEQSGSRQVFSCQYYSIVALHTHISSGIWMMNNTPVGGYSSETVSLHRRQQDVAYFHRIDITSVWKQSAQESILI